MKDFDEQLNLQNEISQIESEIFIGYNLAIYELDQYAVSLDILESKEELACNEELLDSLVAANQTEAVKAFMGTDVTAPGLLANAVTTFLTKIWDAFVGFLRKIGEFLGLLEKEADSKAKNAAADATEEVSDFLDGPTLKALSDTEKKVVAKLRAAMTKKEGDKSVADSFKDSAAVRKILSTSKPLMEKFTNFVKSRKPGELTSVFVKELKDLASYVSSSKFLATCNQYIADGIKNTKSIYDDLLKDPKDVEGLKKKAEDLVKEKEFKESDFGGTVYESVSPAPGRASVIKIKTKGTASNFEPVPWSLNDKQTAHEEWIKNLAVLTKNNKAALVVAEKLSGKQYAEALNTLKTTEGGKEVYVVIKDLPSALIKDANASTAIVTQGKKLYYEALSLPTEVE